MYIPSVADPEISLLNLANTKVRRDLPKESLPNFDVSLKYSVESF
jgi:hypothetical protein